MSDEVALYYNPMSRARTAHWMLEETGAPYRLELVNLEKGEQKQPAFLSINPMGKLPTLVHRALWSRNPARSVPIWPMRSRRPAWPLQ